MSRQLPKILSVLAVRPFIICAEFAGGRTFDIDLENFLRAYKVFRPLVDNPELFGRAKVGEWGWDVVWPMDGAEELDISAITLWRLALEQAGEAMPRGDFRAWREHQGLSLTGAAKALGLSRRMVAYYDSGERIIPKTVMLACKGVEWERRETG